MVKRKRLRRADHLHRMLRFPAAAGVEPAQAELFPPQVTLWGPDASSSPMYRLRLPMPPSANRHWRAISRPGHAAMILSAEGRAYRAAVLYLWREKFRGWPPEPLCRRAVIWVDVLVHYYTRRRIDLDNRLKPLLDALSEAHVWEDDDQIDWLRVRRGPMMRRPGCVDIAIGILD